MPAAPPCLQLGTAGARQVKHAAPTACRGTRYGAKIWLFLIYYKHIAPNGA